MKTRKKSLQGVKMALEKVSISASGGDDGSGAARRVVDG